MYSVSFAFYFRPWATIDWCMWGFSVDFCRVDNPTYTCVSRSVFLKVSSINSIYPLVSDSRTL